MDPILALIVIEQTIATVVIATAIVVYSRATTRILEAHIEPEVRVDVDGNADNHSLTVVNDAGCAISNLNVIISAGCIWNSQPYPVRHCLYFGKWDCIAGGEVVKAAERPITPESFASAELPQGVAIDKNDICVEYSFTRRADNRRYSFKYQLGTVRRQDEPPVYVRLGEPTMLTSYKCTTGTRAETQPVAIPSGLADATAPIPTAVPHCIG